MNRRIFLTGVLAVAGCASAPAPVVSPATPPLAELEPLYRADADRSGLSISVGSNGCTAKADFTFHLSRGTGGRVDLAFARKRVDPCKSFAVGRADLTFSWAELGVTPDTRVALLNPLVAWRGP